MKYFSELYLSVNTNITAGIARENAALYKDSSVRFVVPSFVIRKDHLTRTLQ